MTAPVELDTIPPWVIKEFRDLQERLEEGGEVLPMIRRIYRFTDLFIKAIGLPEKAICKAGCADCCRIKVEILEVEAAVLAEFSGRTMLSPKEMTIPDESGPYCPFIDPETKSCTAYKARPLMCRVFHAVDDVKFCWPPNQKHYVFGLPDNGGQDNPLVAHLALIVSQINLLCKGDGPFDIRDWFKE